MYAIRSYYDLAIPERLLRPVIEYALKDSELPIGLVIDGLDGHVHRPGRGRARDRVRRDSYNFV